MISIIVAVDKKGLIGSGDHLPWSFSEDLQYFKEKTMGKFVIFGEKTFISLKNSLKGRKVIVLSRKKSDFGKDIVVAKSIKEALAIVKGEIMIAGGASVYEQFLEIADRIYLTTIDREFEGDVYFPKFERKEWKVVEEKQGENKLLKFQVLERK